MNPAPAHLEAKLRFGWDFTVGQIAAMVAGILLGFTWANSLSPIHGIGAAAARALDPNRTVDVVADGRGG